MEPVYTWEDNPRPSKRQKITALPNTDDPLLPKSLEAAQQRGAGEVANTEPTLSTDQLPSELRHLLDQYVFTTMSIISSSKMEQKVRNLLLRTKRPPEGDSQPKPGVVILTAKADIASKLVGIVEIAKRTIQQEGGHWWQYSKLHSQIIELKKEKKKPKRAEGGKTLHQWAGEQAAKEASAPVVLEEEGDAKRNGVKGVLAGNPALSQDLEEEGEDDEGAFQTMGRHQVMAYDENRSKIRAIPIMTVYLSQVAVPALKNTCNEQTNAKPAQEP